MIEMNRVSKRYGQTVASVDDLSLTVPEGTTVALIGPSGCGKTTTMRMINRLIEPSSGSIKVNGRDVMELDPVQLRRGIGYVIQQVGLFPHVTIAENIATVPRLLRWDRARTERRVDELLEIVGLEPAQMRGRYPHQLSGGQRQRVGVARALAVDPPVLLMDEPFGAIDPVARGRLQSEFRQILARIRKTVVMVTHDLDEAVTMGDRVAIMRQGRIVQYDTPDVVLSKPVDDFVADFVGSERALKRLALFGVAERMSKSPPRSTAPAISRNANLREALSAMVGSGSDRLAVVNAEGIAIGELHRDRIFTP